MKKLSEHTGEAAELQELMVREKFRARGSDTGLASGSRSPCGARVSRRGQLLSKRAAVTTIDDKKRGIGLEKAVFPALLEHTINVERTEPSRRETGHSPKLDTVPALVGSHKIPQLIFNSLKNSVGYFPTSSTWKVVSETSSRV